MNYSLGKQSRYKYLSQPTKGQQLHLLYPGRLMSNQYHHTGYNIPHEDPEGLERTNRELEEVEYISELQDEKIADYLGGGHPVGSNPLDSDFPHKGDPHHPQEHHKGFLGEHQYMIKKPKEYHGKEFEVESNDKEEPDSNSSNSASLQHHNEPFGFDFNSIKKHIWILIISVVVLILLIIGVIFIVHEVRKRKK